MRQVTDGVYTWSVFSETKQFDFNGLYLEVTGGPVVVDPPALADDDVADIHRLGVPKLIVLTNKDHRRDAPRVRDRFSVPIWIHELDKPLIECDVDGIFLDGQVLGGELQVIHLPNGKSPGESALYWPARRILILGDALIGNPPGTLCMLPDEKYPDAAKAREGLEKLADLDVDTILVGDGAHMVHTGAAALGAFFASA